MLLLPLLLAAQAVAPPARATAVRAGAVSVQAAVDAAAPGDTVRLGSGIHQGPVVIAKPLTLLGMPGATLDGGRRGTVLTVRADSVVIEGLVLTGSGRSLDRDEAAIRLEECTGCRISGTTITEPLHGIYLLRSQGVTHDGCRGVVLTADPADPVEWLLRTRRAPGVPDETTRPGLEMNVLSGSRDGIRQVKRRGRRRVNNRRHGPYSRL